MSRQPFPIARPLDPDLPVVQEKSPDRYWFQTPNGLWTSREWRKGERQKYITQILNRSPRPDEI